MTRRFARAVLLSALALALLPAAARTQDFDLQSLPGYTAQEINDPAHCHGAVCHGVWGVIRISGTELTQHLIHLWEDNFLKRNPNIRFGDLCPAHEGNDVQKDLPAQ